jgi:hypothetical protein
MAQKKKRPPITPARAATMKATSVAVSAAAARAIPRAAAARAPVKVGVKEEKRARALLADIRDREKRVVRNFYQMGLALSELRTPRLYTALGYPSFDALLRGEELMSRAQAYKLMDVVAAYPPAQAVALGFERAYGLVEWARNAPTDEPAASLAERNVEIAGRPVREASVRAIRAETRRLRKTPPKGPSVAKVDRALEAAKKAADHLARALAMRGAENARVRPVRDSGRWRIEAVIDVDDTLALLS